MSFTPTKYDPTRCRAGVRMKTNMIHYRQCKKKLSPGGGYGPEGNLCYRHGVIAEREAVMPLSRKHI